MKVIAKEIEMIAWFDKEGIIKPLKFRLETDDEVYKVIKFWRSWLLIKKSMLGNIMYSFKCKSIINNNEKIYELKYEVASSKWILFKI